MGPPGRRQGITRACWTGAIAAVLLQTVAPASAFGAVAYIEAAHGVVAHGVVAHGAGGQGLAARARTAGDPPCTVRVSIVDRTSGWAAPLDRIVTANVPDASLRDALDRVAELAKVELSYSGDLLPSERRVCLNLTRVPIGALLETLLAGTPLRPIVVGASQIVLAPSRSAPASAVATSVRRASVLDRVVVTGTPDGASQRGSPFALDVIDGTTLSRTGSNSLLDAIELAVPGVWSWNTSAGSLSARFGSVRGASSFGVTTPKIYLDGVEVANPLFVTQIDASRVERIEVIRGPQGAALYGADAISGVINILTRHDGTPTGGLSTLFSTSAGRSESEFATGDVFVQDHGISLRGGAGRQSFGLGANVSTVGAYVPGASERRVLADADVRFVRARAVLTGTARLSAGRANASTGLLYGGATPAYGTSASATSWSNIASASRYDSPSPAADTSRFAGDSATGQALTQYTVGMTATVMPTLRWTNTFIAGIDGYRLRGYSAAGAPLPLMYSASQTNGQGAADRGSFRARAVGRFDLSPATTLAMTFGAEHALTRDVEQPVGQLICRCRQGETAGIPAGASGRPGQTLAGFQPLGTLPRAGASNSRLVTSWINNSGVLAQANLAWRDALFLVAGGRAERTTGATDRPQTAYLPMFGASYVRETRGVTVKLRTAYGTGIRPARSLARAATWMGRNVAGNTAALEPESQSGVEAGVDVLLGSALQLHVTRFDQRASGLIQPVASTTASTMNGRPVRIASYALQNVGAIDNRGWELQASAALSRLRLSGAYTLVGSRVARVADGYGGDLRVGDRMLDVPARTLSATALWSASRWTISSTLSRAEDWVSYDRLAIGAAVEPASGADVGGMRLRDYWTHYDDVTRLRAGITYRLARQLNLELGGDNLFNVQRGAPDNTTVTAGRTLSLGLRTQF